MEDNNLTTVQVQQLINDALDKRQAFNGYNPSTIPSHAHTGSDSAPVDAQFLIGDLAVEHGGTGTTSLTAHGVVIGNGTSAVNVTSAGTSGQVLTSNGASTDPTFQTLTVVPTIQVTAGEMLTAGEVVCLKLGTGNNSTQGYQWVNGSVYAVRAAANDTTYGQNVLGIMTNNTGYLSYDVAGTCALIGDITGLTGLTAGSVEYLDNYSGASSVTISQTTQDTVVAINSTTYTQLFVPTSSRLDKVILYCKRNGGGGSGITVDLKRVNTILASASAVITNNNTLTETTFDFSDVRVYKGEILKLVITTDDPGTNSLYFAYQSTGSPYNGAYQGNPSGIDLTGGSVPASGADAYFKVYEYTNFGALNTSAGTRKFKMGQALSTTELAMSMQTADANL